MSRVVPHIIFEQGAGWALENTLPAGCRSGRCAKQWSPTSRRLAWCITRIGVCRYVSGEYVQLLQDPSHDPEHEQTGTPLR
jgi:hypothetical protein